MALVASKRKASRKVRVFRMSKRQTVPEISREELICLINQWIVGRHAERNRNIMIRRWADGICFEPLAEEFNLSVRHIKDIVYKCEYIIFRHI